MPRFALFDASRRAGKWFLVLISFAVAAAVVFASERVTATTGLQCRDYPNTTFDGAPLQTRVESDLTTPVFVLRSAPALRSFSTECDGTLLTDAGDYNVLVVTRNAAQLVIDGQVVVQSDGGHLQRVARIVPLTAAQHQLRFRYAFARPDEPELLMSRAGRPLRPLRPTAVSIRPVPTVVYALREPARLARTWVPIIWLGWVVYLLRAPLASWLRRIGTPLVRWHHTIVAHPRRCVAVLVSVAVVVRLALAFATHGILWPDSEQYYDTALAYLRGDFFSHNLLSTPLFSAFLATFLAWQITPTAGELMIAAQRVLAIAATLVVFRLARDAFDQTVAFYAALLWTISVVELYYETVVATEALFVFVLLLAVLSAARALRRDSIAAASLAGAICAVATLTRPVAKGLIVIILAVMWCWGRERRRLALRSAMLVITFSVSVAPWMYVNRQTYGFWGISRGEGLWLFLRAFDIDELPAPAATRFPQVKEVVDALMPAHPYLHYAVRDDLNFERGYSAAQADDAMLGFALEVVAAHPLRFAAGTMKQFVSLFVHPYRSVHICPSAQGRHLCSERGSDLSFAAFPNRPPPGRTVLKSLIAAYFQATYWLIPLLAPVAALGTIRSLRERDERRGVRALLALTVIYLGVATAVFNTVQDRYRLPADAFVIVFAVAELRRQGQRLLN